MKNIQVEIVHSKIEIDKYLPFLCDPRCGAQNLFCGVVRNHNHGKKVLAVSYDVFAPLALSLFQKICGEACERWNPDLRLILIHRVGKLEIGTMSVLIGASSPHRDEAFQACRYLIEKVKHEAPIWKKEYYEDGETEWLDGHSLCR